MSLIGAVDIGGTKIAAALVQEDGLILARDQWSTEPEK
jgi:predicted NBD/HSP70 family sugar kinase